MDCDKQEGITIVPVRTWEEASAGKSGRRSMGSDSVLAIAIAETRDDVVGIDVRVYHAHGKGMIHGDDSTVGLVACIWCLSISTNRALSI